MSHFSASCNQVCGSGFRRQCALGQVNSSGSCTLSSGSMLECRGTPNIQVFSEMFRMLVVVPGPCCQGAPVSKGPIFLVFVGNHKHRPFCDALHVSEVWRPGFHHHVSLCGVQRSRTGQAEEEGGDPRACRWVWAPPRMGAQSQGHLPLFLELKLREEPGSPAFSSAPVTLKISTCHREMAPHVPALLLREAAPPPLCVPRPALYPLPSQLAKPPSLPPGPAHDPHPPPQTNPIPGVVFAQGGLITSHTVEDWRFSGAKNWPPLPAPPGLSLLFS